MNRLGKTHTFFQANPGALGPGRLVLVVGPSGAGKDTLLKGARAACAYDPAVVFSRRVVTRPKSDAEDHDSMDAAAFAHAASEGAFALWWQAHGNGYGIPSTIDQDIRAGRTVVCNVSRTVVDAARQRYGFVTVVEITAPAQVLLSRLASRQRTSDGDVAQRLERSAQVEQLFSPDIVIRNVGRPDGGIRRLIRAIRTRARIGRRRRETPKIPAEA
ncbi:MAG TPA: phosphonate metabolism protein/1,5-bisphosphokinase (PRPP-forming) PhnN [Xanthobacteraceae bacterium]|nr:phosphonate metabolism protein/1,5-bisphosphokinase (PRPP-forming) PhnN [Xanthobacteraceae bacterium]